jgi:hypothetical protein
LYQSHNGSLSSTAQPVQRALRGAFTLRDRDPSPFDINTLGYGLYIEYFEARVLPVYPVISTPELREICSSRGGGQASFDAVVYCLIIALGASQYALDSNDPQRSMAIAISSYQLAMQLLATKGLPAYSPVSEPRARLLMVLWCKQSGELGAAREHIPNPDKLHEQWCGISHYPLGDDGEHASVCQLVDSQITMLFLCVQLSWYVQIHVAFACLSFRIPRSKLDALRPPYPPC